MRTAGISNSSSSRDPLDRCQRPSESAGICLDSVNRDSFAALVEMDWESGFARRRTMLHHPHAVPIALAVSISLFASYGYAQNAGPFTRMAGSWSGAGSLTMTNGAQEQLRCRARYNVGSGGSELQLNLRCASPSYNFNLGGEVETNGNTITGSWNEATRNVAGTVSGRVDRDRVQ